MMVVFSSCTVQEAAEGYVVAELKAVNASLAAHKQAVDRLGGRVKQLERMFILQTAMANAHLVIDTFPVSLDFVVNGCDFQCERGRQPLTVEANEIAFLVRDILRTFLKKEPTCFLSKSVPKSFFIVTVASCVRS